MDPKAQGKELADKGAGTLPLCEKGREESAWTQGGWNVDLMVGEMKHFSSCHFYFLNEIRNVIIYGRVRFWRFKNREDR